MIGKSCITTFQIKFSEQNIWKLLHMERVTVVIYSKKGVKFLKLRTFSKKIEGMIFQIYSIIR